MIAASAGALSRATGRGGGTSLPGMVLNRLEPGALARLGGGLGGGAVYISATNGKTTTARLLSACLRADGRIVTANAAGANLASGVTSALLARERSRRNRRDRRSRQVRMSGRSGRAGDRTRTQADGRAGRPAWRRNRGTAGDPGDLADPADPGSGCGGIGVFEVDEAALPHVAGALQPRAVVLMNLFRDQLDRYGELETIAERWGELARSLGPATTLVLNADDPALAHLGRLWTSEPTFQPYRPEGPPESLDGEPAGAPASEIYQPPAPARIDTDPPRVVLFGIDDPEVGRPDLPHAADTVRCGNCGSPLSHDLVTVGHLGHWRCETCGLRRPRPHIRARRVHLDGLDRMTLTITDTDGPGSSDGPASGDETSSGNDPASDDETGAGTETSSGNGPASGDETSSSNETSSNDPASDDETSSGDGPASDDETGAGTESRDSTDLEITAGLGGLHNAYNVTAAVAAAVALGVPPEAIRDGIAGVKAAFGRAEQVSLDGRTLRLLLAKNPTGANENIHCVLAEPEPLNLLVVLNDRTADGRDPSWIWDVDYEPLWDRVGTLTLAGDRCWDLALRFSYGGLDPARFAVRESLPEALDHAVAATPAGGVLYALPTYTALLDLRAELVRRGATHDFWQES